jgi:hypothetical protein
MKQPVWQTAAGDLGTYPTAQPIELPLVAVPAQIDPLVDQEPQAFVITYSVLSGELPAGLSINVNTGLLSGTPNNLINQTLYSFTVRATNEYGSIRDRTFTMSVVGSNKPVFTIDGGELINVIDSEYVSYVIQYTNVIASNIVDISVTSGSLPPGLYITSTGLISGYAEPPILTDGSLTTKTYNFTLQLYSELGIDIKNYSITVRNQRLTNPPNTRKPVILNSKPLVYPIPTSDPWYDYYTTDTIDLPMVESGDYFSFKVIGHDFDNNEITYVFGKLPLGLTGDTKTGWITGIATIAAKGILKYEINVRVSKVNNLINTSALSTFNLFIANDVREDIVWNTDSNLGTVYNGTISDMSFSATSANSLQYRLLSGSLPPNLVLLPNGEIVGRIAYQPTNTISLPNTSVDFVFTVEAYSPEYILLRSAKVFTLTVNQYFTEPVENVYFKASPNIAGKRIIQSLLTDQAIIPTDFLYRARDPYFGKATSVTFVHAYGITSSSVEAYLAAIDINHYYKRVILGELKTAIARDSNNNIMYEVVYSEIIDPGVNASGNGPAKSFFWDRKISLRQGPWNINNTQLYVSDTMHDVNLSPGSVRELFPNSLNNMRTQLSDVVGQNIDNVLLPAWMTSQQQNGETLGYTPAWVICYTLPEKTLSFTGNGYTTLIDLGIPVTSAADLVVSIDGVQSFEFVVTDNVLELLNAPVDGAQISILIKNVSTLVKNNINNYWPHKLNEIDFSIDRYLIDKSSTYNWNSKLTIPAWNELPSATPTPDPLETNDITVLFPRETILPKDIEQ